MGGVTSGEIGFGDEVHAQPGHEPLKGAGRVAAVELDVMEVPSRDLIRERIRADEALEALQVGGCREMKGPPMASMLRSSCSTECGGEKQKVDEEHIVASR